jgi:hypothetical protein
MKIENYVNTADTFTWTYNPNVFDDSMDTNFTTTTISYQRHHIIVSGGGINPRAIILTGHLSGANKETDYRSISKHFQQSNLLKALYFESDKFLLGVGKQAKRVYSGTRPSFVDYVCTFQSVIGIFLGSSQKTYTNGGADATNSGDVTTFVEEIAGTWDGSGDITLSDGSNSWKIPAGILSAGDQIKMTFIKMVNSGSGVYVSQYNYLEIKHSGGSYTENANITTTLGSGILQIPASATASSTLSASNLNAGWTAKFRDGYSA